MFSLIIAIVSIALVVALVAASGYFGGNAVTGAQAKTEATRLITEETQILASMDMFYADQKRWPANVEELVTTGHLRTVPYGIPSAKVASASAYMLDLIPAAYAADGAGSTLGWSMPTANTPVIYTAMNVPKAICQAYNLVKRGDDGILRQPFEVLPSQCYGADGAYQVVVRKAGSTATLGGALPKPVTPGDLPGKDADGFWDSVPDGEIQVPVDPDKAPKPAMELVLDVSDFGRAQLGEKVTSSAISLRNSGNGPAEGVSIQPPAGFTVATGSNCGAVLQPGAGCLFQLDFAPVAAQDYSGFLTVSSSNGAVIQRAITARGEKAAGFSAAANFGNVPGDTAVEKVLEVRNIGVGPLTLGMPYATGPGFSILPGGTCGAALSGGESCNVKVALTGIGATAHVGELRVPTAQAGDVVAKLTGQSQQGILSMAETTEDFGNTPLGATPVVQGIVHTVTNTGNLNVPMVNVTVGAPYAVAWGASCVSKMLAPGAFCKFSIEFNPTTESPVTGTATIAGTSGKSTTLSLSGKGYLNQTRWDFTAPGSLTWKTPIAGRYEVLVVGGGGAGSGGSYCDTCWGGGGGSGEAKLVTVTLTAGQFVSTTVGAGGVWVNSSKASSFGGYATANGGGNGTGATNGPNGGSGGSGGSGGAAGGKANGVGDGGANGTNGANNSTGALGGTGKGAGYYSSIDGSMAHGAGGKSAPGNVNGGGGGAGGFGTAVSAGSGMDSSVNSDWANGTTGGKGGVGYGAGGGGGASLRDSALGTTPAGGNGASGYLRINYLGQ